MHLTADQKVDLALWVGPASAVAVALVQHFGQRLKRLSPAERFQQNVVARETTLGLGRTRVTYAVRPSYVRRRADGRYEVPMLGLVGESADALAKWAAGDAWLSLADHSAGQDMEKTFRVVGTVPPP